MKQLRAEAGEFRGHPVITVYTGHEYQGTEEMVTMGVRKATAVCDLIDQIRVFVEKNEKQEQKMNDRQSTLTLSEEVIHE